jgi:signal recognition particle GTPase
VNQLLNQFKQTQRLMKQMSTGKGMKEIARMFR